MIPSTAHFIWFGTALPWAHALALVSAAQRGGFDRVVLHHEDALTSTPWWGWLGEHDAFEARRLDAQALLGAVPDLGGRLADLFAELKQPAARANMVRAAILASEGGVYLDLDTVTLTDFDAIRARGGFFCGLETIAWPAHVRTSRNPIAWAGALARGGWRDLHRRAPDGWRRFRRAERRYPKAANNAVVGSEPGHAFVCALLDGMLALSPERQRVRFALGTHLLRQTLASAKTPGVIVYPPSVFYPLGPEISEHWFRSGSGPASEMVHDDTVVVHWHASVRTREIVPRIDPAWVQENAADVPFAALAAPFVSA